MRQHPPTDDQHSPGVVPARPRVGSSRRALLLGAAAAALAAQFDVQAQPANAPPAVEAAFLRLSQRLTGRQDLDAGTAGRLVRAFAMLAPDVAGHVEQLDRALGAASAPEAALEAARADGLESTALAIVAAWYTGTVGREPKTASVSYASSLMWGPVADALAPPTYALGGPGWWSEAAPEVGPSQPLKPAPPSAPVGNPGAKTP